MDDEPDLLALTSAILHDVGYSTLTADSAVKALSLLRGQPSIEIVISDIKMPEMDGLAFLSSIRADFGDRSWLQVLFVTGHASIETAIAALRLDAVDFLHKPLRSSDLLATVERVSTKARKAREALQVLESSHIQLGLLSEEAQRITAMLEALSSGQAKLSPIRADHSLHANNLDETGSTERLLSLIRTRDIRVRFFDDPLFADPVWHMLLDLMESRLLARPVYATNLYVAAGVPMSTASRRLDDLIQAGFVKRWDDPSDRRRQLVDLTPRAADLLTKYLSALDLRLL
ncbi:response regulator [Mesorhizobium sp. NBSH29]|uniref:response regulator n=1 Tax=Mesorhizobium sp. NBSH29 TaxID=2654249 RepID=UPI0018969A22|nr:response regulator [Mesorhizobium sp. NBSH29]